MSCVLWGSKAEDRVAHREVAIKKVAGVLDDDADETMTVRMLREIKILRHFRHENVRGRTTELS